MEKILQYKFDHNQKIIYETIRGDIRFIDFIRHEKAKLNDPEHNDSYSLLADIRESRFLMSDEEKKIVYEMFKKVGSKINMKRKCAIITNKPSEVANSELFRMGMGKFSPMMFKVFSTEEAAYQWLKE